MEKLATILASKLSLKMWYEVIGEQNISDAILDRIVHDALRIELKNVSWRKLKTDF
jgi:DNA replication protein DnaC